MECILFWKKIGYEHLTWTLCGCLFYLCLGTTTQMAKCDPSLYAWPTKMSAFCTYESLQLDENWWSMTELLMQWYYWAN